MLKEVLHTIHKHKMLSSGNGHWSGFPGPDSVALLHLLKQLQQTMGITLLPLTHHGSRTEADQDGLCCPIMSAMDVPLFIERFSVPELARKWCY